MDSLLGRALVLLIGVAIGYCSGFQDAQKNESMVVTRIVERIQKFGDRTFGERAREAEEAAEEVVR